MDVTEIVAGQLYQGSFLSQDPLILESLGITHVVNAAAELRSNSGCHLNLEDTDVADLFDLPVNVVDAYHFIVDAVKNGGRVLVHCVEGKSRSSAVVLFYLVKSRRIHVDTALAELKLLRPLVKPNPVFLDQLRAYCLSEEINTY